MPTLKGREESGKGYDKDSPRGYQHSTAPRVLRALCKGKSEKKRGFENTLWWREKTRSLVHTSQLTGTAFPGVNPTEFRR